MMKGFHARSNLLKASMIVALIEIVEEFTRGVLKLEQICYDVHDSQI